ncbi:MAG TPA: sugar-transfer associated ATP-grasp domain-containing protein [Trueperaceae bacterium]|nr:sugar-transfer associated ATP-grasp domain-containing protein [Trueperaceae bacterium]
MTLLKRLDGIRALREGTSAPVPIATRIKAWRHGFSGWAWLLYDLDNNDYRQYVPNKLSGRMANIDGPIARSVLKNKLLFEKTFSAHARVPRINAALERGSLTRLRDGFAPSSVSELVQWVVDSSAGVFIKPVDSSEGRGAHSVEGRDGQILVDKKPADLAAATSLISAQDGSIVTDLVHQGAFGRSMFPDAVNTMRVITMIDPDSREPFVASAIHRFGTAASAPTDNVSRKAIRAKVDVETGVLTTGAASWAYENGRFKAFPTHPETGAQIAGVAVPGWNDVVDTLLGLVRRFPMLAYVGWDAVVGDDGVILIEGNHSPNITQQASGPYLADPRIRRFLEHHGVLAGTGL